MNLRYFYSYNEHLRELFGTDMHLFELSVWIQAFAQSLISVFVPIILWMIGFPIFQIMAFYFLFNAIDVPFNLAARKVIVRMGAKTALIFSIIAELIFLIIFFNLSHSFAWLAAMAFFMAIFDSFYWVSHLYIFAQAAHKTEKMRGDVSALNIVRTIGGLLAPAIGALLLIAAGQKTLIFATTFLMLGSLIPLSMMKHAEFKPDVAPSRAKEFFSRPLEKINYLMGAFAALQAEVEDTIWPFFIFFLFVSIRAAAYIPVIISLAGLIFTYISGKFSVRRNIYRMIAFGALAVFAVWILRVSFINNPVVSYASVFLIAIMAIFIDIPLDVATFERGTQRGILNAVTYRNLTRMGLRALLYLALMFSADIFAASFGAVIIGMFVLFVFAWSVSRQKDEFLMLVPEPSGLEEK